MVLSHKEGEPIDRQTAKTVLFFLLGDTLIVQVALLMEFDKKVHVRAIH